MGEALKPVGVIRTGTIRQKQASSFRYLSDWIEGPDGFAIAPSLPLHDQWTHHASHPDDKGACLPGVLSDCAPDAWGRSILRRAAGRELDEIDYLVAVDDLTRQGALRLLNNDGAPLAHDTPSMPNVGDLKETQRLTQQLYSGRGDLQEIALALRGANASLGGARPKSVVSDAAGELHVAKYTMPEDGLPIERAKVATLALARDVGIRTPEARLFDRSSSLPIALFKRFDRSAGKRVHYMSAQSLLAKHRGEQAYYTDIAESLRAVCVSGERALVEMEELYRRILFTILVSNGDDHLKNLGLLYRSGEWTLAPAFDINPQPHRHRHLKTGISELSGFEASAEAWLEAAPFFEVSSDKARMIAVRMSQHISSVWRDRFAAQGVNNAQRKIYAPAFDHAEMRFCLGLGQSD